MNNHTNLTIGVLALQGAVTEHLRQIEQLNARAIAIKNIAQLQSINALILPGGESTAMGKLMREYGFIEAIQSFAANKKPILGTCAGMILLAKNIEGGEPAHLQLMDFTVRRNGFGRQIDSFQTELMVKGLALPFPAVFIRAPYITEINTNTVDVLATIDSYPVLVKQNHLMACSFHPELTDDPRIIKLFLEAI